MWCEHAATWDSTGCKHLGGNTACNLYGRISRKWCFRSVYFIKPRVPVFIFLRKIIRVANTRYCELTLNLRDSLITGQLMIDCPTPIAFEIRRGHYCTFSQKVKSPIPRSIFLDMCGISSAFPFLIFHLCSTFPFVCCVGFTDLLPSIIICIQIRFVKPVQIRASVKTNKNVFILGWFSSFSGVHA